MNNHLSIVSVLLLIFYMCWYMWDQNKLIQNQQREIETLQRELFFQSIIIQGMQNQKQQKNYFNL